MADEIAKVLAHHAKGSELGWTDRRAVVEHMVGGWRLLSGSARPFDEKLIRAIASSEVSRARNLRSSVNHALLTGGERWFGRLTEIRQPTVVIHGTDDCVLRFEHGLALAREISGARLVRLEGAGHELHPLDRSTIVDSIAGVIAAWKERAGRLSVPRGRAPLASAWRRGSGSRV